MNKPEYIIVHHTGGTDANPMADTSNHTKDQVDAYHRSKGWNEIGYNWFIEKDGLTKKGRDENKTGAHTIGYNERSIGICLAGNFDATKPTEAQISSLKALLKQKAEQYHIPLEKIVPHRNFANKSCYGSLLNDGWARELLVSSPVDNPVSNEEAKKRILTTLKVLQEEIEKL